jgi:hypothetical protein
MSCGLGSTTETFRAVIVTSDPAVVSAKSFAQQATRELNPAAAWNAAGDATVDTKSRFRATKNSCSPTT